MLKILIVDDEALVRAGIRVLLDWEKYGFEVVGEASDGEEAWQAIQALKPDILFTDIRMPKMDGIQLLQKIKDHNLSVFSVILSCFDDFDLVREAMKLGARDYIRKLSVTPDAILTVLNELRPQVLMNRDNPPASAAVKTEDLKYLFVKKLMDQSYDDASQISNIIQNLGFSICLDHYELILFRLLIRNKYEEGNIKTSRQSADMIFHLCNQTCRQFDNCELSSFDNGRLLIINSGNTASAAICARLEEVLKNYTNALFFFGISAPACSPYHFSEAASQAVASLETACFYQKKCLSFHDLTPLIPSDLYTSGDEQLLLDSLMAWNTAETSGILSRMLSQLKERYFTPSECCQFCMELLGVFTRAAKEVGLSLNDILYEKQPITDILRQQSRLESLISVMYSFTGIFIAGIYEAHQTRYRSEISMIKDYIHSHYAENIDLNSVAKMVNISPSHLSVLFKKEIGQNFSSYLIEYRMQIAKRLLANSDICIYEIAEQTGYSNASYFGKAFKKQFGISPEEFRKNRMVKKDIQ